MMASSIKGVFWQSTINRWLVRISRQNIECNYGSFIHQKDAEETALRVNNELPLARKIEHNITTVDNITYVYIQQQNGSIFETIWDTDVYEKYSKYHVCVSLQRNSIYVQITGLSTRSQYLHRVLVDAPIGMCVDHINGNSLDNRLCNLRICTQNENCQNINRTSGLSKERGVSWEERTKTWRARAIVNGITYRLGRFNTIEEAAEVVKEFRKNNMPFSKEARGYDRSYNETCTST